MRLSRVAIALIAALALVVFVAGCAQGPTVDDPDKFIKDARELVTKAAAEKTNSTRRDKFYEDAIQKYTAVANTFKDKPQGAVARYELGVIHETAKGKALNLQQAYNEFTTLLNGFDRKPADLVQRGLVPNEIEQVQSLVAKAKIKKQAVAEKLDKTNSKDKLFGILNLYQVMHFLVNLTGAVPAFSYWFAIVLVTIVVKLAITPLTKKQFAAMKEMQKVAPLVKQIQEKYKGDQQTIGAKTMDLYKEHRINPFASCLPMLIQMPILLLLFRMVSVYQYQFAKGTFLWIGSPLQHWKDFPIPFGMGGTVWVTAGNLSEPDLILVLLYVVSMYISTKLSNVDPTQAEQQKMMAILMPVMFAFIFAGYSSAFLLYWLVFNILQTAQQYMILHKGNEPALVTPAPPAAPEKPKDDAPRVPRRRRRR